ncbi:hypothetical protein [Thiocystis violacea]|uniref:hypothetical protein n=1 Tax=Thiocystis violacea TaxID=13725 RepID=UPI001903468C|nr:hypothetical protein [Thiocystis violacea]MBK1719514.1 hypothetical protein [Thiocystis violacea]
MKRFSFLIPLIWLAGWTRSWAAPDAGDLSLEASVLYVALILAFLGMTVGVFASTKRGFNIFRAAIAGFVLGPFAFLLFFRPGPASCSESGVKWWLLGGRMSADDAAGQDAVKETGLPEPERQSPLPEAPSSRKAKPAAAKDLSSEFAQYSEMLRRTMPGALIRENPIDYAEKFGEAPVIRCSNPDCNRLLPPPHHQCPHCGTFHA